MINKKKKKKVRKSGTNNLFCFFPLWTGRRIGSIQWGHQGTTNSLSTTQLPAKPVVTTCQDWTQPATREEVSSVPFTATLFVACYWGRAFSLKSQYYIKGKIKIKTLYVIYTLFYQYVRLFLADKMGFYCRKCFNNHNLFPVKVKFWVFQTHTVRNSLRKKHRHKFLHPHE